MSSEQTVFIVDDNPQLRKSLGDFLEAAQLTVQSFASAKAFLAAYRPSMAGCLILDIQMPEMSGLELQELLCAKGHRLPIIIVSGHRVVRDVVLTMKMGSYEFIEKPYCPDFLLKRVREALEDDLRQRLEDGRLITLRNRFAKLTVRERQVLSWVISGAQSKTFADKLGLSVSTVDNHRANIMKKLNAKTSADLTRMALLIDPTLAFASGE
jgi:two-component system response regulator FixJ